MWVTRFEWPKTDQATCKSYIDGVMSNLQANNFNAVIFQMRGQADTLYPSPEEPWSQIISPSGADLGWDPMAYAVQKAHQAGLEFHAYINTHVAWQSSANVGPNDPNHLFYQHCNAADPAHRDWLIHDINGNPVQYEESSYVWMSPGVPDWAAYTRRQVMHVVNTYNVDGVHFDRVRLPRNTYSYDPISLARYNSDGNPAGLTYADWMRDQTTRMLRDMYAQVMEVKPQMKVSSAPLGLYSAERYTQYGYPQSACGYQYGRTCVYQDAQAWLAAGAMDFIVPQIYWGDPPWRTSNPNFSEILPDWVANNAGRHIYAGQTTGSSGGGRQSVLNQVTKTRQLGGQGNVIFSYSSVTSQYYSDYLSGPYSQPSSVPSMPWKTNPTEGIIIGAIVDVDGVTPVVDAWITRNGSAYTALSSGDGLYSFLKVPPGSYTLTFSKIGKLTNTVQNVNVTAGGVTRVNFQFTSTPSVNSVTAPQYSASLDSLSASWTGSDPLSRPLTWEYSVGTAPGLTNTLGWTSAGPNASATINGLSLTGGLTYFVNARATNPTNETATGSSSGTLIAIPTATIPQAKALPDGTYVSLLPKPVSADFTGEFYLQEPDRSSAIGVSYIPATKAGRLATVAGFLTTTSSNERIIQNPTDVNSVNASPVIPLRIKLEALGGQQFNSYTPGYPSSVGLNNLSLLVKVVGKVIAVAPGQATISDGNAQAVFNIPSGTAVAVGDMVKVTGISSATSDLSSRLIKTIAVVRL